MSIVEMIQANQLSDAIAASKETVREKPTDVSARSVLSQLFCIQGDWERADTQLATIAQQSPDMMVGVGLVRQLMRGEVAREQFFAEGATPELVADPSPAFESLLMALISIRENANDEVTKHVAEIQKKMPVVKGTINGEPFEFARDLDDLMSGFMEVLTTSGKYFLIPIESISSLSFREPERLQDQIWRSANIEVHGGMEGEVYIPTRYSRSLHKDESTSEAILMGGETAWVPLFENGPVTGRGLKTFALGDNAYTIMEINHITIDSADGDSDVD